MASGDSVESVDVLIIGGGPTGLGAATCLHQMKHDDWLLLESAPEAGGLAGTDITDEGFLFDLGGHVIFSHYKYFDDLLDAALGTGSEVWANHQRISYVYCKQKYVPYPFQNNLSALPVDDQVRCFSGLLKARLNTSDQRPETFDDWILKNHGEGIAELFMRPYNFKVWATHPRDMQCKWLGERVATVDIHKVFNNIIARKEDAGWGPNATFRYPQHGGTGAIWKAVSQRLPRHKQRFNTRVCGVNNAEKLVTLDNGKHIKYNHLITTMPLDTLLDFVGRPNLAMGLRYSTTHIVGVGVRGAKPRVDSSWLYYSEDNCPFYRVTIFSNYAKANVPNADVTLPTLRLANGTKECTHEMKTGPYWSIMCEISESDIKPVDADSLVDDVIQGVINVGLLTEDDQVVSIYKRSIPKGYPTPNLTRDACLEKALRFLDQDNIYSRGRFGAWKYEVGNQDHSLMQGVEIAWRLVTGQDEVTVWKPDFVNSMAVKHAIQFKI